MTHREQTLAESGAPGGERDDLEHDRQQIDALDLRLIEILRDRRRVSARIQQRRLSHGGARIAPHREQVVIERYRQGLGPEAVALVRELLSLCRGPAAAPAADRDELSA